MGKAGVGARPTTDPLFFQESAVLLLGRRVAEPAWWASLDVYLRSLPAAPFLPAERAPRPARNGARLVTAAAAGASYGRQR